MRLRDRLPNYLKTEDITNWHGAYDYIIYKDGTYAVAISNLTGLEVSRAVDVGVVTNACIALMTNGGSIWYQPGNYSLRSQIASGTKGVNLTGQCGSSSSLPSGYAEVIFTCDGALGAKFAIKMGSDGAAVHGSQVNNIIIAGVQSDTFLGGIHFRNIHHGSITNCMVNDMYNTATPGYGFLLDEDAGLGCYYNVIKDFYSRRCTVGGKFGDGANANTVIGGQFTGRAAVATYGLQFGLGGGCTVLGTTDFETHAHANGIAIYIASGNGCHFFGMRFEGNQRDIVIDAGGSTGGHEFFGYSMAGTIGALVTDNGATKSHFLGRIGYITEKWGSSTGSGAQQTIAHGLGATPTLVLLSDKELNAIPYQSAAADATNIFVTAAVNQDWSWYARI